SLLSRTHRLFPGEKKEIAMTRFTELLAAAAAISALAVPAAAQYYPQPTYPQYPQQTYPQQTYPQQNPHQTYPGQPGYNQGYTGNPAVDIIDQLLGNRYSVTDRQAVRQCANAARAQAAQQYGAYGNNAYPYGQGYGQQAYGQGYNSGYAGRLRVTAITNVERRSN